MKIKDVQLNERGQRVRLEARCKIRKYGWDTVFFEFDKKYKPSIVNDASPFMAAMLIPSMRYGDDLEVKGSVSAKLYKNLKKMMEIMTQPEWEMQRLKKIRLQVSKLNSDRGEPNYVGTSFSSGVDSFYTLLKHRSGKDRITHLITVDGFDIDLRNRELWGETIKNIREVADEEGLEIIEVKTNIKELLEPMLSWEDFCGGGLSAVPMCLRGGLRMSYLSSGFSEEQQFPAGSTLEIDRLWSTEKFSFVHDGAEARRVDKVVKLVGNSQLALQHLRVCHDNLKGIYNCGKCDKCMRTMVSLTITGTLSEAKTFPNSLDLIRLSNLKVPSHYSALFQRENLEELEKRGLEQEVQKVLRKILKDVEGEKTSCKSRWIYRGIYLDHRYAKGVLRSTLRPLVGNKF